VFGVRVASSFVALVVSVPWVVRLLLRVRNSA
jgi:hypothetical protein